MKGYAVSTVIKILACVIALVIVVFLIYKYVLSPSLPEETCAAEMTSWCTRCKIANFEGGPPMSDKLEECINKGYIKSDKIYDDCSDAQEVCKGYLPLT